MTTIDLSTPTPPPPTTTNPGPTLAFTSPANGATLKDQAAYFYAPADVARKGVPLDQAVRIGAVDARLDVDTIGEAGGAPSSGETPHLRSP